MSDTPDPDRGAATQAAQELERLKGEIGAARAVLVRLLQDVVDAETALRYPPPSELVEINEKLVVTALRAQAETEMATRALNDVSRSAELDSLTQLPNRLLMLDRLAQAITQARRHRAPLAVMFLDLDNFKDINDTLGHAVGDEVLKLVAGRLASTIRAADSVGRYGGDEFLILLVEVTLPADATLIADKLLAALSAPTLVGEHVLRLAASIGISIYPDDGTDPQTLIADADAAMYHAKRLGLGRATWGDLVAWKALALQQPDGSAAAAASAEAAAAMAPTPVAMAPTPVARLTQALADHDQRHALLREANEKLVLAALDAQHLQAAAEAALQRQSTFLAIVADELSDPQAPIRLATAMLGRTLTDEPLLPRAQEIFDQRVAQISQVVNTLHAVSHAGDSAMPVQRLPIDLGAVLNAAVVNCRPDVDMRMQHLELRLPARPVVLQGDFARLVQAVSNLLANASQYTTQGGRIELSAEVSGDAVVLTVADNGIGISASAMATIFEPFVQDSRAAGYNGVGPGIGLTAVRAVVQAHGGTVLASSDGPGRGSRFVVTLPLGAGAAAA